MKRLFGIGLLKKGFGILIGKGNRIQTNNHSSILKVNDYN